MSRVAMGSPDRMRKLGKGTIAEISEQVPVLGLGVRTRSVSLSLRLLNVALSVV